MAHSPYQLLLKCRAVNAKTGNDNAIEEEEWCLLLEGGKVKETRQGPECSNSEFAKLPHHQRIIYHLLPVL